MIRRTWLVWTFASLLAASASAMSIRELRALENTLEQGSAYTQYYLVGVLEGLVEANAAAVRLGGRPQFCQNGRKLEPRMASSMYLAELKRRADLYEADMPVQMVLLNALATAYLC